MPRDNARHQLNGVFFAENGDIVCTDGNRCHAIQTGERREEGFILSYDDVKRIIKSATAAQRRRGAEFFADLSGDVVAVGANTTDILCKPVGGKYVDYIDFFPAVGHQPQQIDSDGVGFDCDHMQQIAQGISLHAAGLTPRVTQMKFYRIRSRNLLITAQGNFRAVVVVKIDDVK